MDIDKAWIQTTGTEITIELLGGGVTPSHPDLAGRVIGDHGEGGDTPEAGVMVANTDNGIGIAGINWNASVCSHAVADVSGYVVDDTDLVAVLSEIAASRNRIILNTYRLSDEDGDQRYSQTVRIAMRNLYMEHDKIIIARMGEAFPNSSWNGTQWPAGFNGGVISVGASEPDGTRLLVENGVSSKSGDHIDFVAPGSWVRSTNKWPVSPSYTDFLGTSMAAAHVAGVVSLLLSFPFDPPELASDDVEALLLLGSQDISPLHWDPLTGWGRVNAELSINSFHGPGRKLFHFTDSGSSEEISHGTDPLGIWAVSPAPGYDPGFYPFVEKIEVLKWVEFPHSFVGTIAVPDVWGRGAATTGYPPVGEGVPNAGFVHYSLGFCEVVSSTQVGAWLRTYVYRYHDEWGATIAWFPCAPENITWGYSVLGDVEPTSVHDSMTNTAAGGVRLGVQSPTHGLVRYTVLLSHTMNLEVDLFSAAGARVATMHTGQLPKGSHSLEWRPQGREERLSAGVYFVRVRTATAETVRKVLFLR